MRVVAFLIAAVLTGCGPSPSPSVATTVELPTAPTETPMACAGVGLAAVLQGDPNDPQVAWLDSMMDGAGRQDVIWPAGYTARFTPDLEILDADGHVVIRGGDFVDGGCVEGPKLLLMPPLLALRLECGPMPMGECTNGMYQVATANGWPERAIAEVRFLDADGRYRLTYEDGSSVVGVSTTR